MTHPHYEKGGVISPKELEKSMGEFALYNSVIHNGELQNLEIMKKIDFHIKDSLPAIEEEWYFEAELPFNLDGWLNSEDLSKWEKDDLEKAVVSKYTELRNILNNGNSTKFLKELEFCNNEFFKANYYTKNQKEQYLLNLKDFYSNFENKVKNIENYNIRILGNGKAVALEIASGFYKGNGILTAIDTDNKKSYITYVILHKPQGSDTFEIVRCNSYLVSTNSD